MNKALVTLALILTTAGAASAAPTPKPHAMMGHMAKPHMMATMKPHAMATMKPNHMKPSHMMGTHKAMATHRP